MARRLRLLDILLTGLLFALAAEAGPNYFALLIRSTQPADTVVLEKFLINDKDELLRLNQEVALSAGQYKKLARLSLGEVRWFRVTNGGLQVRAHNRADLLALPQNFKGWRADSLAPAAITRGSSLQGRALTAKGTLSLPMTEGWVVYLFPSRPGEDAIAFALAETQNTEEGWRQFLGRYPTSQQAAAVREILGSTYLGRAQEALSRFQEAFQNRRPGYPQLGEARRWINQVRGLNYQTPAAVEAEATLNRLEADIGQRLRQARLLAENADFSGAQELLEPLFHFRNEFPELAAELEAIRDLRARYHVEQARQRLSQAQFDEAERELQAAVAHRELPEIAALREEIQVRRVAYAQQREIEQVISQAQEALGRNDYAQAFETLWPVAVRFPQEPKLQDAFSSLRHIYSQSLLTEVPKVEELHTPIQGPADEDTLLRSYDHLAHLGQFEPLPSLAVWRDRLSQHLADYYRQKAKEVAPRGDLAALSFAYLQQAWHFMLDKSELTDFAPQRDGLEGQLQIGVTLTFRDLTPEAANQNLMSELSSVVGEAIQGAGFPHVRLYESGRATPVEPKLEFVVELLSASVHDEAVQAEIVSSEYSSGVRQVPNPAWRTAKEAYDRAVEASEGIRRRLDGSQRQKKYGKKERQADEVALQRAEAARQEVKKTLDALPAFVDQEDVRPYEFSRKTVARTAEMRLAYRWINVPTGLREVQNRVEEREPTQGVEVSGVHPADKHGNRNQASGLPEAALLRGRVLRKVQEQLTTRAIGYLKTYVEREFGHAQQEAERGSQEVAAEHYLRFLFNSLPDDTRRERAFAYLKREFRLVTLGEWLPVPGETAAH